MTESTAVTFETGYERLQRISERVTSEEVPVAEMCDLFAEGKGLQKALSDYLNEQKSRVEAIDRGEGVQTFEIVAPSSAAPSDASAAPGGSSLAAGSSTPDDDIPF